MFTGGTCYCQAGSEVNNRAVWGPNLGWKGGERKTTEGEQ